MKITKFPQSCILVETKGQKILVDAGNIFYEEKFLDYWKTATAILITHKHDDHLNVKALSKLSVPIYSTQEVQNYASELKINIVKTNDIFNIGEVKIEVVKAIHGFIALAGEITENVGYIIDDGKTRLYITSDSIRFKTDFKADVMLADVTAFDASMNLWGSVATLKDVGAKFLIVAHQEAGKMMYSKEEISKYLNEQQVDYIIPEILQTFEI